jgi:hypothetical protein
LVHRKLNIKTLACRLILLCLGQVLKAILKSLKLLMGLKYAQIVKLSRVDPIRSMVLVGKVGSQVFIGVAGEHSIEGVPKVLRVEGEGIDGVGAVGLLVSPYCETDVVLQLAIDSLAHLD